MFCENCGKEIAQGADFCTQCGTAVKKIINMFEGENKIILVLITMALGYFGIHNFVLGETKKGVTRIAATFLLWGIGGLILALIDLVKIARGTYKVDTEAFI